MSTSASSSVTLPLLLEIGCEEIPARFLSQAQKDLGERLQAALVEARLLIQNENGATAQTYSTPRRLVATVAAVLDRQPDKTDELMGPPVKVAFDAAGKPTRAAESFAQKNSADVKELFRVSAPKGEYLALRKTTPGRSALEVLSEILPGVITGVSFPKSMYWEASKTRFVRPIRWIVAVLGEGERAQVVRFAIAGVESSDRTCGHRLSGGNGFAVTDSKEYAEKLRAAYVEFDPESRRQTVRNEVNVLLEDSLEAVPDQDLEDWIVNSTEWVSGIRGSFDPRFLHLPREILVTVMRDHQKYFAVEDKDRMLAPYFITILSRDGDPKGVIRQGHERVLTARFSDAEFFWNADQKVTLAQRFEKGWLDRVTYQAKLGSYGDKIRRMEAIAKEICRALEEQGKMTRADTSHVLRAVQLCKCDLTTQMVQEFTELQGVVGGLYAKAQGEPKEVADAIYDHYLPQGAEDKCPQSLAGAAVSLADKLDLVAAGFVAGLEPTGSSDPFGLRRAGNGIIKLAVEVLPDVDLDVIAGNAVRSVEQAVEVGRNNTALVFSFLQERLGFYLREITGFRHDIVKAVLQVVEPGFVPSRTLKRALAFQEVRGSEDFLALAHAARRTRNILEKSATAGDFGASLQVNEGLLQPGPERALYDAFVKLRGSLNDYEKLGEYDAALRSLATLRQPVDLFFDKVLVMDQDPLVRGNRLRLLANLDGEVFSKFGDLSQIESPTSISVDASTSQEQ